MELDELANNAMLAKALGERQDKVGRSCSLGQLAGKSHAKYARDQHRHWLAEHRCLSFNPADTPAEHAKTIDHRRVGVGANERVDPCSALVLVAEDNAREILKVHLMDDAGLRWHDGEAVKRTLAPAQEGIALVVSFIFEFGVLGEGRETAERINLDGVVNHELGGHERVDPLRVAAQVLDRVTH